MLRADYQTSTNAEDIHNGAENNNNEARDREDDEDRVSIEENGEDDENWYEEDGEDGDEQVKERWVKNISSRPLSSPEMNFNKI